MTDVIAQLREAHDNTSQGEWPQHTSTFEIPLCPCGCSECRRRDSDRYFASLVHNNTPAILAVLEAAQVINEAGAISVVMLNDLDNALAALKGGAE